MAQAGADMLAQAIKGKSDEEIYQLGAGFGGTEALIDTILNAMAGSLDPSKAQDSIAGYVFTEGDKTYPYAIEVAGGKATVKKGEPHGARVVVRLSAADFFRLIVNELDGTAAFMSGKITADGDVMFIQTFMGMFSQANA